VDAQPIIWGDDETRLSVEESPRSVRAIVAGETVAASKQALLLRETGRAPVYYVPLQDVRRDLLEESEHETSCRYKGQAGYWSLAVGGRRIPDAAWSYREPPDGAPDLSQYVAFAAAAVDAWREEDDPVLGGLRDPYHRVDAVWSDRAVRVELGGTTIAESERPCLVFETGYPTRYYFPREHVRTSLLTPTPTRTECPYKGVASYWSATIGGRIVEDVAWSYEDPLPTQPKIAGLISFWPERVDAIEVDGLAVPAAL
jgi:uncharacterized protein (DUF427 family)